MATFGRNRRTVDNTWTKRVGEDRSRDGAITINLEHKTMRRECARGYKSLRNNVGSIELSSSSEVKTEESGQKVYIYSQQLLVEIGLAVSMFISAPRAPSHVLIFGLFYYLSTRGSPWQ
jgi:hypothetical protein